MGHWTAKRAQGLSGGMAIFWRNDVLDPTFILKVSSVFVQVSKVRYVTLLMCTFLVILI